MYINSCIYPSLSFDGHHGMKVRTHQVARLSMDNSGFFFCLLNFLCSETKDFIILKLKVRLTDYSFLCRRKTGFLHLRISEINKTMKLENFVTEVYFFFFSCVYTCYIGSWVYMREVSKRVSSLIIYFSNLRLTLPFKYA